jgi:hypothetical protein
MNGENINFEKGYVDVKNRQKLKTVHNCIGNIKNRLHFANLSSNYAICHRQNSRCLSGLPPLVEMLNVVNGGVGLNILGVATKYGQK